MTVADCNSIDLVATSADGEMLLMMVEQGVGTPGRELLDELRAKLTAYLSFARDQLAEEYRQLAGRPVHIQLRAVHEPGAREFPG